MSFSLFIKRGYRILIWVFLLIFIGIFANAVFRPTLSVHLILPNKSVIKRPFYIYPFWPHPSLYAKDGKILLAKNVEGICFNDHYVEVVSYDRGEGGIYGAQKQLNLPILNYYEELEISGLSGNRKTCNGYYTAMLGPSLLFEGNKWPFLPSCDSRNFENKNLQDRSWFDRPCADELPPRYYSSNPAKAR